MKFNCAYNYTLNNITKIVWGYHILQAFRKLENTDQIVILKIIKIVMKVIIFYINKFN